MRVLMTTDAVGGVWTYALELADALAPHGVEVALATMGPAPSPSQRADLLRSAVVRSYEQPFALEWMDEPWDDVRRAGEWLVELERRLRPDVVHLNGYVHAALPWRAPVLVAGHSDVLSWHRAVRGGPAPAEWGRYEREVGRGLAAADALVAPTRALLAELERLYRPTCPASVVPNGRTALAAPRPKEPYVVAAGRLWDEAKNVAALDRVAPRLDWPVLLAGAAAPGWAPAHARSLGRLDSASLGAVLARAAVYAAPARYEPFGLGPLEAGLAGCALVLGDVASLREVWEDAALYVDPGDDDSLAAALQLLIAEPVLREELGAAALDRARTYTPERMAAGYLDLYRRLAARPAAVAPAA
jgi:glycogen synthase